LFTINDYALRPAACVGDLQLAQRVDIIIASYWPMAITSNIPRVALA